MEFLSAALGVALIRRLNNINELPNAYNAHVQSIETSGGAWIAWLSPHGPIVAWGKCDLRGSRRINAYLLKIEWFDPLSVHHSLWAYCDPKRPTEWTIGRGVHEH
jgi:hypothetical protein